MKFRSNADRMSHPQARLIPNSIWDNSQLFNRELSDALLPFMRTDEGDLINLVQEYQLVWRSPQQQLCAWLAIALSHPDLSNKLLFSLAQQLTLSKETLCNTAIRLGNIRFFNELLTQYSNAELEALIAADNYYVFRLAAENGHLPVVERLMALAPEKVQAMIASGDYEAFRLAANRGHLPVVNRLLQFSAMFAYAEMHQEEYGARYIHPFTVNQLATLRAQKTQLEQDNPNAVFDIQDPEEANLLFYIIRNLIRRNDESLLDDIRFLLEIPAVKALAHTAVTPRMPNELLRLALTTGNQAAAELLLNIPAINTLAEQNNYYRNEVRGGLDLRALVQDRESSMRALSTGEERRLQAALERYQPMIKQASVHVSHDRAEADA